VAKKRVPPARLRWAARNRTIGVTVPLEVYEHLLAMRVRSGKSFGRLFKESLGILERDLEGARQQGVKSGLAEGQKAGYRTGYDAGYGGGYDEAESEFKILFTCPKCGASAVLRPGTETTSAMLKTLVTAGWTHSECIQQQDAQQE
jgi:hypothetical protein